MRLREAVRAVVRSEYENLLWIISYQPVVVSPLSRESSETRELSCSFILMEDVAVSFRELPSLLFRSKGTRI